MEEFLKKHLVQKHARSGSIDYTNSCFLRVCYSQMQVGRSCYLPNGTSIWWAHSSY